MLRGSAPPRVRSNLSDTRRGVGRGASGTEWQTRSVVTVIANASSGHGRLDVPAQTHPRCLGQGHALLGQQAHPKTLTYRAISLSPDSSGVGEVVRVAVIRAGWPVHENWSSVYQVRIMPRPGS